GVASADATWLKTLFRESSPEAIRTLRGSIGRYWGYSHGTQIADIAVRGNPAARLMWVETNEWPNVTDSAFASIARAEKVALNFQQVVDYMKQHGVRVANLSWGNTVRDFELELQKVVPGMPDSARSTRARALFEIIGSAVTKAIASAPDILFVVTIGNE